MTPAAVTLEPWREADAELLERLNTPAMTEHLGGPEAPEQLARRHRRYLAAHDSEGVFVFRVVARGQVAFWERAWRGERVYEMGWGVGVVREHWGRGFATAAAAAAIDVARELRRLPAVHAFPAVGNAASNALCRRLGFELLGEHDFEHPPGHQMRCSDWPMSLARAGGQALN